MKVKTKQLPDAKPAKSNSKEFSSLEQVVGHFFPEEERKRTLINGKELGADLAEEVFENLLKAIP
jgi:hypothetical protein